MSYLQIPENQDPAQEALHPGAAQEPAAEVAPPSEAQRQPGETAPPPGGADTVSAAGTSPLRGGAQMLHHCPQALVPEGLLLASRKEMTDKEPSP